MRDLLYVFQYFRVVPPVSPLMSGAFLVVAVLGAMAIAVGNEPSAGATIPVIVLQGFSAATGFSAPARRGYFDLLLARGEPRARIAVVQWLTAIAPGMGAMAILVMTQVLVHRSAGPLVASGTLMALGVASTVPWAVTVALPRFSGAIGWLLLVSLGTLGEIAWPPAVRAVLYPPAVVGDAIQSRIDVLLPAVLLSAGSLGVALWWVHRTDIRLESAQ